MKGVYTASKTVHAPLWKQWRDEGVPVISTWIDEAGPGESTSLEDLWVRCVAEASRARLLVVYRESGEVLKGAFVEVGAALASGVPVLAVGDFDGMSFIQHPFVRMATLEEARIRSLKGEGK